MKHPLATPRSLQHLATVVATLLGQAFADGPDRAPILPKTHAAPAPPLPADLADAFPSDDALLLSLASCAPEGERSDRWRELERQACALLGASPKAVRRVHPDGHDDPFGSGPATAPKPP